LPQGVFKLRAEDDFHFQPAPNAKYRNVECALTKLKQIHGLPKMGFIGSETYEPEPKTKAQP
jgi:hypothetical protein